MNDRPDASELLRAVERFLEREVVPELSGPRRYHARVAANVVAIVAREIETEEAHQRGEWERLDALLGSGGPPPADPAQRREALRARNEALNARIRAGELDWTSAALMDHLRRTVADKLSVARPPRLRND